MLNRLTAIPLAALAILAAGCAHMGDHTHITMEATPAPVIDGFHHDFPGLTLSHVDSVQLCFNHGTEYEVKFRDADNNYHRRHYSPDGKLLDGTQAVAFTATTHPAK